jgi:aspartate dehydrogenase
MRLGIVGQGAIGQALVGLLAARLDRPLAARVLLVRPRQLAETEARLAGLDALAAERMAVAEPAALLAARPDLVVECAGHGAVEAAVAPALAAGIDCVVASVGALADPGLHARLVEAAASGGARLALSAGAVGGIDLLAALRTAGLTRVAYTGRKPPAAWRGTKAEAAVDLAALEAATIFFEGDAQAAARDYPKNANVAATVALAGLGFAATEVRLVADPAAAGNVHEIEVEAAAARFAIRIEGLPSPDNPRTSASTMHALAREVLNRIGPVAV